MQNSSGRPINLAPLETIALWLAIFERTLGYVNAAGERLDRDEMLLGGHLADLLHHVPAFLIHFESDEWHHPERFTSILLHGYEVVADHGAPTRIVETCRDLLRPVLPPGELGLIPGFRHVQLAPKCKLVAYLDLLFTACLTLRQIRNFGFPQDVNEAPSTFWIVDDENWRPEGDEAGRRNSRLAALLLPIPRALVNWETVDEDQLRRDTERLWTAELGEKPWTEPDKKLPPTHENTPPPNAPAKTCDP